MNVLFAPDWREGVPYQRLLGEALEERGVAVSFLRHYRRAFPLARLVAGRAKSEPVDILHLHWPEAYFPRKGDRLDWFRLARFSLDLTLARRRRGLVVTAHNFHAHNRGGEYLVMRNSAASFRQAQRIIAHSAAARDEIVRLFGVPAERIRVIPHGDLSIPLGAPLARAAARAKLGLGAEKVVLMFGTVEPYKGIEEVLECWKQHRPEAKLVIVGKPSTPAYGAAIAAQAEGVAQFRAGWLSDEDLRDWLSAADAVIFNYRTICTSGAASLTRSYGVPIVLPSRLRTVDLNEPSPYVHRFQDLGCNFLGSLEQALKIQPSYEAAADWRDAISWPRIAAATADVYREAVLHPPA